MIAARACCATPKCGGEPEVGTNAMTGIAWEHCPVCQYLGAPRRTEKLLPASKPREDRKRAVRKEYHAKNPVGMCVNGCGNKAHGPKAQLCKSCRAESKRRASLEYYHASGKNRRHQQTLCKRGHSLTDAYVSHGKRRCRTCELERLRVRRAA